MSLISLLLLVIVDAYLVNRPAVVTFNKGGDAYSYLISPIIATKGTVLRQVDVIPQSYSVDQSLKGCKVVLSEAQTILYRPLKIVKLFNVTVVAMKNNITFNTQRANSLISMSNKMFKVQDLSSELKDTVDASIMYMQYRSSIYQFSDEIYSTTPACNTMSYPSENTICGSHCNQLMPHDIVDDLNVTESVFVGTAAISDSWPIDYSLNVTLNDIVDESGTKITPIASFSDKPNIVIKSGKTYDYKLDIVNESPYPIYAIFRLNHLSMDLVNTTVFKQFQILGSWKTYTLSAIGNANIKTIYLDIVYPDLNSTVTFSWMKQGSILFADARNQSLNGLSTSTSSTDLTFIIVPAILVPCLIAIFIRCICCRKSPEPVDATINSQSKSEIDQRFPTEKDLVDNFDEKLGSKTKPSTENPESKETASEKTIETKVGEVFDGQPPLRFQNWLTGLFFS